MQPDPAKMARYASVGLEFSSPIVAGAIVGHYLDQYFNTDPYITLVMFLLGVFVGFRQLIVTLSSFQKKP